MPALLIGQVKHDYDFYKTRYPNENIICKRKFENIKLTVIKDSVSIVCTNERNNLVLDDNGALYNKDYVYEDYFVKSNIEEAYSLVPNGKKMKRFPVKDIKISSSVSEGIFFDDEITKSVFYEGLIKGAETFIKYTDQYKEPRFFGSFFFQSGIPVDESGVSLECPKDMEISFELLNADTFHIVFSQTETAKSKIYNWKAEKVLPFSNSYSDQVPSRYYVPHIIFRIKSYTAANGKRIDLLNEVKDLFKWQSGFISTIDKEVHKQLKFTVDSLTKNASTEQEKIKAIFSFVQDNIKYLAIEDKLGGFIPRQASDILKHKYGDCKDIANLTNTLMTIAGINSHLTWIGTRDKPYACSKFPSPMCFNHMIVYIKTQSGEGYFLDGTGKHQAWYFPTSMIQGKEGLIGIDSTHFEVLKVPEIPMEKNTRFDSIHIAINDKILNGTQLTRFSGFPKEGLDRNLDNLKNDDLADFIRTRFATGNNKISVAQASTQNQKDREKPTEVMFNFTLPSYIQRLDKEIFINMNISKPVADEYDFSNQRKIPIEHDFKHVHATTVSLDIPAGGKITYLPKDAQFQKEHYGFSIHYKVVGQKIIMERKIYINELLIDATEMNEFSNMLKQLKQNYSETISINLP